MKNISKALSCIIICLICTAASIAVSETGANAQTLQFSEKLTEFADQNLNYPGNGGLYQLSVPEATKWDVTAAPVWCPAYGEGDILNIKCRPNTDEQPRTGTVTVKMSYRENGTTKVKTATFAVSQEPKVIEEVQEKPETPEYIVVKHTSGTTTVPAEVPETVAAQNIAEGTAPVQTAAGQPGTVTSQPVTTIVNVIPDSGAPVSVLGTYNGNSILGANWTPSGVKFSAAGNEFSTFASANFVKFQIIKGFSTSVIKADAFRNTADNGDPQYIFSGTVALLNGEMRVGGTLFDLLDVSLLGTYSYLPKFNNAKVIPMNHYNGLNYFIGVELGSCIPVFNANVRFGYQGLNGNVSMYDKASEAYSSVTPVKQGSVVLSLGITLGGNYSKGSSILRIF